MENSKPIKTFRIGSVGASVWMHKNGAAGTFYYEVSFSRAWRDKETGKTGYSQSYPERHLDTMIDVAIEAKAWIEEQNGKAPSVAA